MALPEKYLKPPKWLPIFEEFIGELRINSKEAVSVDKRGARLELWGSQSMFLKEISSGLDDDIRFFYCVKSRQLGITTICFAIDLFWLATNDNMMGAFVADTEKNSNAGRATLVKYVESMPRNFVGSGFKIVKNNRDFILFSNGSRLDFLIAGTREKKAWGEGRGYTFCHCTEVANYGSKEGMDSFLESLAQNHPKRLFIFESTTKGFNHWRDSWNSAGEDEHTKKRFFIGFWSKELNRIKTTDPRYLIYGTAAPDSEERELIDAVKEQHNFNVSKEALAWWRWKASDSSSAIQTLHQNQPWTAEQAFVLSGQSFFPTRMLRESMELAEGGVFRGFRYWMGNDFWAVKCEEIFEVERLQEVELRVWEDPVEGASYVIGCDPAWGRNDYKDRTAITVFRCFADKLVQVAEYANEDKDTRQSAWVLAHLAGAYKNCLSEDSEILTRLGWKRHDEISIGDEVVGFDTLCGEYKWEKIKDIIIKEYHGDMIRFESDGLDQLVTPDHRVIMRHDPPNKRDKWNVKTAIDASNGGKHSNYIPKGGCPIGSGISNLSLDMCRILGWIITDGYRRKYELSITQAKSTFKNGKNICEEIDRILPKVCKFSRYEMKGKESRSDFVRWVIRGDNKEKFDKWLCDGNIHRIPRYLINEMSEDQLQSLFNGLLEGDGGWYKNTGSYSIFCAGHSEELADGFQEVALKLGYSAVVRSIRTIGKDCLGNPQTIVRISKRKSHSFRGRQVTKEKYDGKVWCVSVPSGAFVMRRGGKASVTGNCEVIIELTGGCGKAVLAEFDNLRDRMRAEIYQKEADSRGWEDFLATARHYLYKKPDHFSPGFVKSWETNGRTKFEVMNQMRDNYQTGVLVPRSVHLIAEMTIIVQDGSEIGAPEPQHDDRVFAASFANRAYIDDMRLSLISQGHVYDIVMAQENGEAPKPNAMVNNIVVNFFKQMEEREEEVSPHQKYLQERGLI